MFCLLALPFHIFFGLLFLPFVLLKWMLRLVVGLALLPIVLLFTMLVVGVAFFVVAAAVLAPLIPFALAAAFIWMLVRLASPRRATLL